MYFVTAIDGDTVYYMAGPYKTHEEALQRVDGALDIANKHDGRAWFMSWGTSKSTRTAPGTMTAAGLL